MRSKRLPVRIDGPDAGSGSPPTIGGILLFVALIVGSLIAVSYPVATLTVAALAVIVRYGVVVLARMLRPPTDGEPICVPGTNVCLGA